MAQKLNMAAAQLMIERQAVARRDYQTANIAKATAEYITEIEKELEELKGQVNGKDAVSDTGADVKTDGEVA